MSTPVLVEDWQAGGFGLYIHWPFCEAKCPYCDFNSFVSRNIDHARWRQAYLSELKRVAEVSAGRTLNSVYFGGGTPSLMAPETVGQILETAQDLWTFSNDIEITLEANPGSVEAERFGGFRQAGVNRVSLGVQALNDQDLRLLGRIHTAKEARAALDVAKSTFDRVSFDLICARQHQSLAMWEAELKEALQWGTDHLSIYQLTIEPGTAFGERYNAGKLKGLPDDEQGADMYFATQEICNAHGMPAYEVSNHARPGQASRHNMIYWQYGDYLGIGPGAHGRITVSGQRHATETRLNPNQWLDAVENNTGWSVFEPISGDVQADEYAMMSLRTTLGMDLARFGALRGRPLSPDPINGLLELGMVRRQNGILSVTPKGRPILNAILAELLQDQ